jgi:CRP-like cAMP-binding protein
VAIDPSAFRYSAFDNLPGPALERLASCARKVCFTGGERIAPLINPPKRLVVLLTGLAKLTGATVNGHERIMYVFRPGDLVGSRVLLEGSVEASYEVIAMTRVEGVSIELSEFYEAGREHLEIVLAATNALSRRLNQVTNQLMAAMSEDVSLRLCHLLLDFVRIDFLQSVELVPLDHHLTHETMASIIGASRPHTSSVLAMLENKGVVRRMRRSLLVNPIELQRYLQDEDADAVSLSAASA